MFEYLIKALFPEFLVSSAAQFSAVLCIIISFCCFFIQLNYLCWICGLFDDKLFTFPLLFYYFIFIGKRVAWGDDWWLLQFWLLQLLDDLGLGGCAYPGSFLPTQRQPSWILDSDLASS